MEVDEISNYAKYPATLQLEGKACLVVGGGSVSERKISSLLAAGAVVTVISPSLTKHLAQWAREGKIQVEQREYQAGDIHSRDALLVFAATGSAVVNNLICAEAASACRLCNSIDDPEGGSFT
ncbi:MAG: bifunctional precorrin-2 dehydrogenase/sirohydrochlorin ferrochelatase, partial [Gorillibacterium sp.]|nr:bifunctional precorrin-2 dehydrogenase/sirohydrochlorin ferrochelatase [Gorillibacterium sp.]